MSRKFSTLAKVVSENASVAVKKSLENNIYAVPTRASPNAAKLIDGAIQRASVQPSRTNVHVALNKEQAGFSAKPFQGTTSSGVGVWTSDPWGDFASYQNKTCRIYMKQTGHNHNHPEDKTEGTYWHLEFPHNTFKSPLMGWNSGMDFYSSRGESYGRFGIRFGDVNEAIMCAETHGWGYDVIYPRHLYHVKKNYADNFAWKGDPKEEAEYD